MNTLTFEMANSTIQFSPPDHDNEIEITAVTDYSPFDTKSVTLWITKDEAISLMAWLSEVTKD